MDLVSNTWHPIELPQALLSQNPSLLKIFPQQYDTHIARNLTFPPTSIQPKHRFPKLDTGTDSDWFKMGQGDSYVV